ncbi:HlyD family efflux transporter periplasmic adaptor subunit [Lyngbya aestuarii]|uniref:HlyD family efflux transporter periplasmic adaptor subunit n=1 Tax=Lyngbya aestuarii TaxID=118322 RepID=UPI00403DB742
MHKPQTKITATASSSMSDAKSAHSFGSGWKNSFLNMGQESSSNTESVYGGKGISSKPVYQRPSNTQDSPHQATSPTAVANAASCSTSVQTLLDQPPSSLPQRIILGGLAFSMAFGAWATLGQIDEVGHAQGRLVPKGEVYKINPIGLGKTVSIHVEEGEAVQAGQVLLELDTELADQEVERLEQIVSADQNQLTQMQALIDKTRLEAETRTAIAQANAQAQKAAIAQVTAKTAATRELISQNQAMTAAAQDKISRLKPLVATTQELIRQRQVDAGAQQERLSRLEPLLQEGAISKEVVFQAEQSFRDRQRAITESQLQEGESIKEQLFQAQQSLRNHQSTITQSRGELEQTLAQAAQLEAELTQKQTEVRRTQIEAQQQIQKLEVETAQLKAKIADNQNLIKSAQAKLKQQFLYAPVDGVVSSLNVANVGEVVQPGQSVAEIAPQDAPLVLSASLPSSEAGFVKEGMPVQVRLDAYPYQDYGIVRGKVTSVSGDAKADPQLGAVYKLEVTLDRNYVSDDGQTVQFKAGQTASADIIIRRRRIADLLLDPIRKLQEGGLKL